MEKKKWDDVQQRARVAHDWAVNFFLFFHPAHPLHVAPPSWWWWRRKVHTSQSHAQMIQHRKIPLNRINFHLLLLLLLLKRNSKNRIFLNIKKKKRIWYLWAQVVVFLCAALYRLSNKEEDMMMMMRCGRPFVVRFATEPTHAALFLFNTRRREILSMCVFSHLHTSSLVFIIKKQEENREDILHRIGISKFYLSSIKYNID
jgi:hypothetical protein